MKISTGLTLTLRYGDNEFIKPYVVYTDLDLKEDIDKQLEEAKQALKKVNKAIINSLQEQLSVVGLDIQLSLGE